MALIGVASLTVLYQLFMALRWYRKDRRVMAMLSDGQISVYRQSRGIFQGLGTSLFLMFLAAVGIAFVFSQLR